MGFDMEPAFAAPYVLYFMENFAVATSPVVHAETLSGTIILNARRKGEGRQMDGNDRSERFHTK